MLVERECLWLALQGIDGFAEEQAYVELSASAGWLSLTSRSDGSEYRAIVPCEGELLAALPIRALLDFTCPSGPEDLVESVEFQAVEEGKFVVAAECVMITLAGLPLQHAM